MSSVYGESANYCLSHTPYLIRISKTDQFQPRFSPFWALNVRDSELVGILLLTTAFQRLASNRPVRLKRSELQRHVLHASTLYTIMIRSHWEIKRGKTTFSTGAQATDRPDVGETCRCTA
jgi:hypothetical protein